MTWTSFVEAHNTATESTNRMHDDTVAATFGFRGGLVPGVDVWAYMTRPCIDRWGVEFLTGGTMQAAFRLPVYDGERVESVLEDNGALTAVGPDGTVRAAGTASMDPPPRPKALPSRPRPDQPPEAAAALLAPGTVLGTLHFEYRADLGQQYLRAIRETGDWYRDGSVCHPGFLARQANYVLSRSVLLGPWIHVETRAHHRGVVRDGDTLEVRGVVDDERQRKGHRIVDLDVEITANGVPVWSAFHTAIWRPRATRSEAR